jgi:hypothetical protein
MPSTEAAVCPNEHMSEEKYASCAPQLTGRISHVNDEQAPEGVVNAIAKPHSSIRYTLRYVIVSNNFKLPRWILEKA